MPSRPPLYDPLRASRHHLERAERRRRDADPHQRAIDRMRRGGRWKRVRALVLNHAPLCVYCENEGRATPATDVDHITPITLRPDLAYTLSNLQPLCKQHHASKSARERAR